MKANPAESLNTRAPVDPLGNLTTLLEMCTIMWTKCVDHPTASKKFSMV